MAFCFGTDVGSPPGTFGEEGIGTGICVTLDTRDNPAEEAAFIECAQRIVGAIDCGAALAKQGEDAAH